MYRAYKAVKVLNQLYKRNPFDLLVAEYELFIRTWLFTDFKLIKNRGEIEHYEHRKEKMDDLMSNLERLGYIKPLIEPNKKKYIITTKGRDFLNPIIAIEQTAREFGYLLSLIGSFLCGLCTTYIIKMLGI